jgi:copper chaperone NosL
MSNRSRILILIASLGLGLMFVLPVWRITLEAPQYPEGLGMVIRIDDIAGVKEHDLNNINNLNHYIGMRPILPDEIPELQFMPWIVAGLMLTGVLTSVLGRRRMLYAWTAAIVSISVVGMADFYKWEYDYGHNLDMENAIIKIPGMSYQPPLIGSREILNFTAHSWPGGGGWAGVFACGLAVALTGLEMRQARRGREALGMSADGVRRDDAAPAGDASAGGGAGRGGVASVALLAVLLAGCADPEPRALEPGVDICQHCLMVLDADAHGTELVTSTGVVHTFDSVECLISFLETGDPGGRVHSLWVTDFGNPRHLVPAKDAWYLVSPTLGSPMGLGVTAFAREQDRDGALDAFGGEALSWRGVKKLVTDAWPNGRPVRHGGHGSELRPEDPPEIR